MRPLIGCSGWVTKCSLEISLVALTNYTGHPTLTLRAAVVNGRPRSVTLVGRLYEEGRLISLGMALERRLDVRDLRPPID